MRKKIIKISIGVVVLIVAIIVLKKLFFTKIDIATAEVKKGEFVIKLIETGELDALRSVAISVPRGLTGGSKIIKLAPEGSVVQAGDFLVQFDPTEAEQSRLDMESQYKSTEVSYQKTLAQAEYTEKLLQAEVDKAQRTLKEKQGEAPAILEEAKTNAELAQLKMKTDLEQSHADQQKAKAELDLAKSKLDKAKKSLENTKILATAPGLVVYANIWGGSSMRKVQEGDSPWSGQTIVNLPDLSVILVKASVNEADIDKVKLNQEVNVVLDAHPDTTFRGTVTKIANLARTDYQTNINVFDVEVTIQGTDQRLKPGMSAKTEIIIEKIPNKVWVPIESVFEKDGKTVVYAMKSKKPKKVEVKVGRRNDTDVIIESGLKGGEKVCLRDPTVKMEELGAEKEGK
jgi:HlyD family secretion protein